MAELDLLIRNTSEVLTVTGDARSAGAVAALRPIPRGAVGVRDGRIAYLGPEADLPHADAKEVIDARGGFVGPGFVDAHTHVVFAGERSGELEQRLQGATYQQLAAAGGGILATVRSTRAATEDELVASALPRLRRLLAHGVTCAEVKSGYGLSVPDELKMLRAVAALRGRQPVNLVPTLLCAHSVPQEHRADRETYIRQCIDEIVPAVAKEGLAAFCDAFVEEGAFTPDEARQILGRAKQLGLVPRLHVDQLREGGGAQLAAELGAATADHLEFTSEEGIAALARAGVSAVLVPVSTLFLQMSRYAPGRKLWDAGVNVALGSNVNPGSAMSENFALTLGLACLGNGLAPAEAYWAATRGGALALGLTERGRLLEGGPADVVVFGCSSYRHLPYHLGVNHVREVVCGGRRAALEPQEFAGCS